MARLVRAATDRNPPTLGGGGCQGNREWGRIAIVGIFALGMLALSGWLAYKEQYQYAVAVLLSPFAVRLIAALFGSK